MRAGLAAELLRLTGEHMVLVGVTLLIASAIGIPGGILLTRRPPLRRWGVGFANVVQTIPSLALFGFLIPIPLIGGIGQRTAIIALVLYALLPILRNTLVGIVSIDPAVRESAVALGMTPRQLAVEGGASVGGAYDSRRSARGHRNQHRYRHDRRGDWRGRARGVHFSRGVYCGYRSNTGGSGSIGSAGIGSGWRSGLDRAAFCVLILAGLLGCGERAALVVGAKNFTEQLVLGEILAQHLENRLGVPVDRRLNLQGTLLAHQALVSGEIDLYPEYTGTALTAILDLEPSSDPAEVHRRVRERYMEEFQVDWMPPFGFNNSFVMVVPGPLAREYGLDTVSDAARAPVEWLLGTGYEFETRPDGLPALEKAYPLKWKAAPKTMDLGLLYRALEQEQVTMAAANGTDGMLAKLDVKVLEDDRHVFPPYEAAVAVRSEALKKHPALGATLGELSGHIDAPTMQQLNYALDGEHRPLAEVAAGFLAKLDTP